MKQISTKITNKGYSSKQSQAGFTLLEILIALSIAAVMLSVAVIAFKDNEAAKLRNKAHQLLGLMQVAQEESIIRGLELGLRVEKEKYYFMLFDNNKWSPLNEHDVLREIKLDEPIEVYVHVEGQESLLKNTEEEQEADGKNAPQSEPNDTERNIERSKKRVTPQVFMLSSGEMNEFSLTIGLDRDEAKFYRIKGNIMGEMRMTKMLDGHYRHDWDLDVEEESE